VIVVMPASELSRTGFVELGAFMTKPYIGERGKIPNCEDGKGSETADVLPMAAAFVPKSDPSLAVEAVGLEKRFGEKVAVERVDLRVNRGSFFGVVGPNGAGKTTSMRMITCLLKPDAGYAYVDGLNVWEDPTAAKHRFGVLPDDLRLFERLSGIEMLTYVGLLRRLTPEVAKKRAEEMLEVLGLTRARNELVTDYSQGMRKKIGLGAAMLHVPAVLFLDEPFESVDPVSCRKIQEVLALYRANGGTVIFSSHVMETVQRLCDHVAIVHDGKVVAHGPTAEVCGGRSLEQAFIDAVEGGSREIGELDWLHIEENAQISAEPPVAVTV
jgi:ABC-2 type transport system ATP-binding protein